MAARRTPKTPNWTLITLDRSDRVLVQLSEWGVPVRKTLRGIEAKAGEVTVREMREHLATGDMTVDEWTAAGQTGGDTTDRYGNDIRGWDR